MKALFLYHRKFRYAMKSTVRIELRWITSCYVTFLLHFEAEYIPGDWFYTAV